jgi:phage terminase small subunit
MIVAKLSAKQQRFCDEYLIDLNATQAAIRTGYSPKTAYSQGQRLLKDVEIKAFIDSELERIRSEKIADATEVMEYLTKVLRGESQSEIVVVENIGDFTSEARTMLKAPDEKERLKAAELLGKRYNLFSDKMKVDVAMPVVISGGEDLED